MMKPESFFKKNVMGALAFTVLLCTPQYSEAQTPSREEELRTEALMQFDRIEGLRNGQIPKSKFATLDHVWHPEALYQTTYTDTDPLDIVMRRTRALFDDLSKLPENETARFKDDLIRFEMTVRNTRDPEERKKVYMDLVQFRRELAFSNPLLDFDRILFVKHKKNPRNEPFGDHMAGQYYGIHATKDNEGLFILENAFGDSPTANNLLEGKMPEGAYLSPELSFDGNKILFAFTEAAGYKPTVCAEEDTAGYYSYSGFESSFTDKNAWHIFSVNTNGTELKQLTHGVFNDFDPCWLPSGQIVFISDRRGGFGRCHMGYDGGAPWFSYTLHRMNADGSKMERLSHHETCEWQPSILHDGMIVYTRWDYVDRGFYQAHHPWTTTPDGRNAIALHGNYPLNWYDRPCMEMEIRAIPGSQKLMALAAAHHGQTYGSIVIVDPNVDDNDAMSNVKIVTPDERFPESEYGYFCREASDIFPRLRADDRVGLRHFLRNGVHVGHCAHRQLVRESVIIQAGAAGHDLHALGLQSFQIFQRVRTLAGQRRAAIVEKDGLRKIVKFCQGINEPFHQDCAQFIVSFTHFARTQHDYFFLLAAVRQTGGLSGIFSRRLTGGPGSTLTLMGSICRCTLICLCSLMSGIYRCPLICRITLVSFRYGDRHLIFIV